MLHIFDQFPISNEALEKTQDGDTILLTDNAVYAAQQSPKNVSLLKNNFPHLNLCVRNTDLVLRNISNNELYRGVAILDDTDLKAIQNQDKAIRSWN